MQLRWSYTTGTGVCGYNRLRLTAMPEWPEEDIRELARKLDQLREDFAAAVAATEGAPS